MEKPIILDSFAVEENVSLHVIKEEVTKLGLILVRVDDITEFDFAEDQWHPDYARKVVYLEGTQDKIDTLCDILEGFDPMG